MFIRKPLLAKTIAKPFVTSVAGPFTNHPPKGLGPTGKMGLLHQGLKLLVRAIEAFPRSMDNLTAYQNQSAIDFWIQAREAKRSSLAV